MVEECGMEALNVQYRCESPWVDCPKNYIDFIKLTEDANNEDCMLVAWWKFADSNYFKILDINEVWTTWKSRDRIIALVKLPKFEVVVPSGEEVSI